MSLLEFSGPLNGNCDHKMSRKNAANLALTGIEPYEYDGHPKKEQETSPWPRWAPKSYKWDYKGKICTPFITGKGPTWLPEKNCHVFTHLMHLRTEDIPRNGVAINHAPAVHCRHATRSHPKQHRAYQETTAATPHGWTLRWGRHCSMAARFSGLAAVFETKNVARPQKHAQRQKDRASQILRCFFWRHKWTKMWFS